VLTATTVYGTQRPIQGRSKSTLEKAGLIVNVVTDDGQGDARKTGNGVVQGTTLNLTETCAFPKRALKVERAAFTATASDIKLYGAAGGLTFEQTYTKQ
jgi:hypothetical protein